MTQQSLAARTARAALALALASFALPALAQTPAQPPAAPPKAEEGLEVITVTATRREATDVQTTPVAVTALSETAIDELAGNDLGDIASLVPNFSSGKPAGFNAAAFAIRGVGQTSIIVYADAQVGVAVDDFVIPHIQTQAMDLFDIQQVEVLRGPQGTLFGKNTTGGMVNVRTKRPVLGEWGFEYQQKIASYGRFEERFASNIPIGETFALRAAGAFIDSEGFYRNGAAFGPVTAFDPTHPADGTSGRGQGQHVGGDDLFSGRIKALWEPTDGLSAQLTYEILRDDSDSPPSVNGTRPDAPFVWNALGLTRDPGNPLHHAAVTNRDDLLMKMSKGHRVDVNGYYANVDWTLGDFSLHSITGWREQTSRLPSTYTGEVGPNSLFDATRDDDRQTFQQELRANASFELPAGMSGDAVAGFFYQKDDTDFCVLQVLGFLDLLGVGSSTSTLLTDVADPTFFDNNPQILCNKQRANNWALYFDTTINLTQKLALSGGFRWTHEHKAWAGRHQVFIQFLPDLAVFDPTFTWQELKRPLRAANFHRFPDGVVHDSHTWNEPTGRATISYQAAEGIFTYFTYAHGFKSGAYNDQTGTTGVPITPASAAPTDPEIADSYEVGAKLDLLDNRLRLNTAGFYVKYSDAQRDLVATFTNPFGGTFQETRFFNAAELTASGIELELQALLTDWAELRGNFGWIHSKYKKFQADTDFDGIIDVDLSDRKVNRSVPLQGDAELVVHHDFGPGEMRYSFGVDYEAEAPFVYASGQTTSRYDGVTDQRTLFNASITVTGAEDRYFVRVYGHNLTNNKYRIGELPVANLWTMSYYGEPRAYGLEVGVKFSTD
jgi:iron complex outermembrane receptor protein